MNTFSEFKIKNQLLNGLADLGIDKPTPIQQEAYSPILAGRDFVGIAQTGTGKTFAFLLPILQDLKYSKQIPPRVLILVPTRELVIQIVEEIKKLTTYINVRYTGVYGGTNIKTQKKAIAAGIDIIVGTPRRLYDLVLCDSLRLKSVKKMVIDEVDIMLDFGYKTQIKNIFDHLPTKRQNLLFSATMTTFVDELISDFLINPARVTISLSGTPLQSISQTAYNIPNFYSRVNLLNHLLSDKEVFNKVLIFVPTRKSADLLNESLEYESEISLIHAKKTQSHRSKAIEDFENGDSRILIATDVISRGIDIDNISTVISFNTPLYPENYMHRIGRTGRAEKEGRSILLYSDNEITLKEEIENLMDYEIPLIKIPDEVKLSSQLTAEERGPDYIQEEENEPLKYEGGGAFHQKSAKNTKVNAERKSYKRKLKERFKKPIKRGDKIHNMKKKKKRR